MRVLIIGLILARTSLLGTKRGKDIYGLTNDITNHEVTLMFIKEATLVENIRHHVSNTTLKWLFSVVSLIV